MATTVVKSTTAATPLPVYSSPEIKERKEKKPEKEPKGFNIIEDSVVGGIKDPICSIFCFVFLSSQLSRVFIRDGKTLGMIFNFVLFTKIVFVIMLLSIIKLS